MAAKKKKETLPALAIPVRKLYELFWLIYHSKSNIETIDLYEAKVIENLKFTKAVSTFIMKQSKILLTLPHQKLLMPLLDLKYVPNKLDLDFTIPIPSDKVFKISNHKWIKEMIEIFILCEWPEEDIYNEVKRFTGVEIFTQDDIRSYGHYFWNFDHSSGWDNSFREPLFKLFLSDAVLSNYYSKAVELLSGELTPEEILIEMDVDDTKGILRNSLEFKTRINIKKNLFLSSKKGDAQGVTAWGRADQLLNKKELIDEGRKKIILPSFSLISDKSKSKKDLHSKKDSNK